LSRAPRKEDTDQKWVENKQWFCNLPFWEALRAGL
jgi:hypothetical protein